MEGEQTVGQNQKNAQEPDMNQLRKVRRDKLAELQQNGRDPFQITKFDQTHHSLEVKGLYEAHEAVQSLTPLTVCGYRCQDRALIGIKRL